MQHLTIRVNIHNTYERRSIHEEGEDANVEYYYKTW